MLVGSGFLQEGSEVGVVLEEVGEAGELVWVVEAGAFVDAV